MRFGPRRLHQTDLIEIDPSQKHRLNDRAHRPRYLPGDWFFPQSVHAEAQTRDGVVLETSVFDYDRGTIAHPVVLQIATSWRFTMAVAEADLMAMPENGFRLRVRAKGLKPDQRHYFRFIYLGVDGAAYVSPTGMIAPRRKGDRFHTSDKSLEVLMKKSSTD